jgi:hypothetical protein
MKYEVKHTGKVFNLFVQIFLFLGILFLFALRGTNRYGGDFLENFLEGVLIFFIFIIGWIFTIPKLILRKRIPKLIEINEVSGDLIFVFPKMQTDTIPKDKFAYYYYSNSIFSAIVIYKKIIATRGHIIYNEHISIIGNCFGIGWSNSQLERITSFLKKCDCEYNTKGNSKLFILRLVEE